MDAQGGGFHDRLDLSGCPVDLPKRVRVQARQIYVFAQAGALGWSGPWEKAVRHGLDFLERFQRNDGLYRGTVALDGVPVSDSADLYDQAFVLFALAAARRAFPEDAGYQRRAESLLTILLDRYAHPLGGFKETDGRKGLRSNPHMHMLEALLDWTLLAPGSRMTDIAKQIVQLAQDRMIDPHTGAVGENFADDWTFMPGESGSVREPGHQFEWSYLFGEVANIIGIANAPVGDRLYTFGNLHGVRDGRALFALDASGEIIDGSSRLWAQTERLRAAIMRGETAHALESANMLRTFFDVAMPGLWHERMAVDGAWIEEAVPASSLYHIMTAFERLIRFC